MIKPITIIILAALILVGAVFIIFKGKNIKSIGKALVPFSVFIGAGGVVIILFPHIKGNLLAFFLHVMGSAILIVNLIGIRIRLHKPINKKILGTVMIVASAIALIGSIIFAFRKPFARVLKPIEHSDGITRSLYVNSFYRAKLPGYDYVEPDRIEYYSGVTQTTRPALVMLPKNYDESRKYPVMYILHGLGGNEYSWIRKKADIIIQNMCNIYDCPEMIVVFPNSELNKEGDTSGMGYKEKCKYYDKTEEDVVNYLMPYINEHYSVLTGRENTAVLGNSMGGRNSMNMAFKHQDLFGYVGVFSSAGVIDPKGFFPPLLDELKLDEEYGDFNLLMLMVGKEDHVCGEISYDLHAALNEAGIQHIFYDVIGTHQNIVWQNGLYNFCMRVFR